MEWSPQARTSGGGGVGVDVGYAIIGLRPFAGVEAL